VGAASFPTSCETVATQRQSDQRHDVTSAHQTASYCIGVSRSDTRLADDVIVAKYGSGTSQVPHRSPQQAWHTAITENSGVVDSTALKQRHQSTAGVFTGDRIGTDKILDDVINEAMLKNAKRSLSFDCGVNFNGESRESQQSRSRQVVKHRPPLAGKMPASLVTDKLTAQLAAALADFKDVAVPYLEDDVIDALHRYLRIQSPHQQPTAETGATPQPARKSTLTKPNTTRPSTASAVLQRPPPSTNGTHRQPLQIGRQAHRRRWLTTANLSDFRRQRLIEFRQGDVGPLSDLIIVRSATPQPSWKPSESQIPVEDQSKARQPRHIQPPSYRAGKTKTTHQAQNAGENDRPVERSVTSLQRTASVDDMPPAASCCSSCHQAHADGGRRICLQLNKVDSVQQEQPSTYCDDNMQSLQPIINKVQPAAAQSSDRRHVRRSSAHVEGTNANVDKKLRLTNNQQNIGGQSDSRKPGAVSGAAILTLRFDTSFTT
jgi:hypothetical protein